MNRKKIKKHNKTNSNYEIGTETDRAFHRQKTEVEPIVSGEDALYKYRDKRNTQPITAAEEKAIRLECQKNIVDACQNYSMKWLSDWTHFSLNDIVLCIIKHETMPLHCLSEISWACEDVIEADPHRQKSDDNE